MDTSTQYFKNKIYIFKNYKKKKKKVLQVVISDEKVNFKMMIKINVVRLSKNKTYQLIWEIKSIGKNFMGCHIFVAPFN